jgi:hypothetical protein
MKRRETVPIIVSNLFSFLALRQYAANKKVKKKVFSHKT